MTITICKLCGEPTTSIVHQIELEVLAKMKKDHPEWKEADGACDTCLTRYQSDAEGKND